ncbi:MAG: hypothetical protein KBF88_16525 [Polyangiaceae bacterium]|nr:hypothetical protein [Polyangiaceae bacterium]
MSWRVRVNTLLEASRALKEEVRAKGATHPLVNKIVGTSGLSPEGVVAAFAKSLEPYEEIGSIGAQLDLLRERMLRVAKENEPTHVVLSSNVFTASLRAVATALAVSDHVRIAPSSRDPDFIEEVVKRSGLPIEIRKVEVDSLQSTQTHVYGDDHTLKLFGASGEVKRPEVFGRGSGFGIGLLSTQGGGTMRENMDAFALDMSLFDQRGCLSPRVLLTDGFDVDDVALCLFQAVERLDREIPVGHLTDEERAQGTRFDLTSRYFGNVYSARCGMVTTGGPPRISPGGRSVGIVNLDEISGATLDERIVNALGPHGDQVTILGTNLNTPPSGLFPRVARFGNMQSPPLDGPADLRGLL